MKGLSILGEYLGSPIPTYFCQIAIYSQSHLAILMNTSVSQEVAHTYQAHFSVNSEEQLDISNSLHMAYLEKCA